MRKKGRALRKEQEGIGSGKAAGQAAGQAAGKGAREAPSLDFTPVPRRFRHDGWTPERQKAFIEALADTGCVTRAAAMVNMAQPNCYTLRRSAGAESFRRAWDAALDFGLKRLKDIAFERAIEGYLVPVFVGGKLMGFRRKHNDALLMFCLRHYGQDENGRRTTINYFSTRASAGAASQDKPGSRDARISGGAAEASATTVRTVINSRGGANDNGAEALDTAAAVLDGFEGVALDAEAEAAIAAALEACAARARASDAAYDRGGEAAIEAGLDDADESFVRVGPNAMPYLGPLESGVVLEEQEAFAGGEDCWRLAGLEMDPELARIRGEIEAREAGGVDDGRGEPSRGLTP